MAKAVAFRPETPLKTPYIIGRNSGCGFVVGIMGRYLECLFYIIVNHRLRYVRIPLCLLNLRMTGELGDSRDGDTLGYQQRAERMPETVKRDAPRRGNTDAPTQLLQRAIGTGVIADVRQALDTATFLYQLQGLSVEQ